VHAHPLEIAPLTFQELAQRRETGVQLFQALIDVSPLLHEVALKRGQTLLKQSFGILDDPGLLVEVLTNPLQRG